MSGMPVLDPCGAWGAVGIDGLDLLDVIELLAALDGESIGPSPVSSHFGSILNCNTIFCIAEVPTLLRPLEISVTIEALIPNLAAKSRLSLTFLSLKSVSYASIKRAETSFFASIIQNIELFSPKNLAFNTEYCIFAACLRINARPKIVKKAENNEFLQLK